MQTITVNITSGNWTIETAVVQLKEGTIVGVELQSGMFHPVHAYSAEVQRKFWTSEYTRLNWAFTPEQMIAKAIGTLIVDVNPVHVSEDNWVDAAFEDRFEMSGF